MKASLGLSGFAATALLAFGSIGFAAGAQSLKLADSAMATASLEAV